MAELQKDPITRSDFLGFGAMGAIMGAILTLPPVAFVLGPIINVDVLGHTDVDQRWFKAGSVRDVPAGKPQNFEVDFPITQSYGNKEIQKESGVSNTDYTVKNSIWVSWKAPVLEQGKQGSRGDRLGPNKVPGFVESLEANGSLTPEQAREATQRLNVMSNSCAHLGCPVRWIPHDQMFLCPCHGGLYDLNGGWVGGPPPRGLYNYTFEVREDGNIYVRHQFDIENRPDAQQPYVV